VESKDGFLVSRLAEPYPRILITDASTRSYAGTGIPTIILAYFIVPEVARRSPAEIDERKRSSAIAHNIYGY